METLTILQFTGPGGKEYIVCTQDAEPHPDDHIVPGYKFEQIVELEATCGMPCMLPLDEPLHKRPL